MIRKMLIWGIALLSLSSSCYASDIPVNNDSAPIVSEDTLEAKTSQENLFQRGVDALHNKDYSLAIQVYTEYLNTYGPSVGAYNNRAIAYNNRAIAYEKEDKYTSKDVYESYNLAIDDYGSAIKLSPQYGLYVKRGKLLYEILKYKDAATDFEHALKKAPNNKKEVLGEIYIYLGYCYMNEYDKSNKYDKSEEYFKKALSMDDSLTGFKAAAKLGLGRLYSHQRKDYNTILSEFDAAINYSPNWALPYYYKFNLELGANNKAEALQDISAAIKCDSKNGKYYYERANLFIALKQYNLGIDDFNKAQENSPNEPSIYLKRGNVYYLDLGDKDKALSDYLKFIELTENKPAWDVLGDRATIFASIGYIFLDEKEFEKSIENFSAAIVKREEDAEDILKYCGNYRDLSYCYSGKAWALMGLHKYDEALIELTNAITYDPGNYIRYVYRGDLYRLMGEKGNAFADYYKAMQLTDDKNAIESIKEKMKM